MTIGVFALDGLDYEYIQERGLFKTLEPTLLRNDLEGANALYTYRVWPSVFAGVNGGRSDEPYASYEPEKPYLWEKYSSTVVTCPAEREPVSLHQDQFPEGYMEASGPQDRLDKQYAKYRRAIDNALDRKVDVLVLGCKTPDILGHHDQNETRIHCNIDIVTDIVEEACNRDEITDWLVMSDHGFEYEKFGDCPSGLEAHTRRAFLCSSFAHYDELSTFIEWWQEDLAAAIREKRMDDLGYI